MKTYVLIAANREWEMYERYCKERPEQMSRVAGVKMGVGKSHTYLALARIAHENEDLKSVRIVNIGLCGCNVRGAKIYDLVVPKNFLDADRDNTCEFTKYDLYPEDTGHDGPTLMSGSKFVTDPPIEAYFDMEGFCVNVFCREYGATAVILKLVSDNCSEQGYEAADPEIMYQAFKKALDTIFL